MRISHKRKKEEPKKKYFFNESILAPEVLVLGNDGASIGVMKTGEAIRLAREQELDLVEINPKSTPPVARIMNFGQYQYQQEKESRLRKAHQHVTKVKCVRLSLRIGANDMKIRKEQAVRFLEVGDMVKAYIVLRGREMQQVPLAIDLLKRFLAEITADCALRYDQAIEKQGNLVTAIIAKA